MGRLERCGLFVMAGLVPAIHVLWIPQSRKTWMPGTRPGTTMRGEQLVIRARRIVEHVEGLLKLRRDRDVEPLAGRQARDEPLVVERDQVVVGAELAERTLHDRIKLRLALAEHDAVGIVGEIVAGHANLVLR